MPTRAAALRESGKPRADARPGSLPRRPETLGQRERALAAAAGVLASKGFDRARLRDVAEAAGVSIGLLQNYFVTRDDLLEQAFSWMCDELIRRWREHAASASDPWERLAVLIAEAMNEPDPRAHSVTWVEFCSSASRYPQLRPPVARVYETWRQILVEAVEEGVSLGIFEPAMPVIDVADGINAVIDGLHMAMAAGNDFMNEDRFLHLALSVASELARYRGSPERPGTSGGGNGRRAGGAGRTAPSWLPPGGSPRRRSAGGGAAG
jgi:AcrR family transcriptional regulator